MNEKGQTYQGAIDCLNTLQSNGAVLRAIKKHADAYALFNIPKMNCFIERSHFSMEEIDSLPIIHVSGTKGKGTTCTYTERILKNHGYKTGLFTSPHMLTVRERIKINGEPLAVGKFTHYFWQLYDRLSETKDGYSGLMPTFFQFLTCMALSTFIQEKVDVAILEVGIGGQYDSTNIIRKPIVCGVTSIGIDHVSILGDTASKIAWHKAGIIKPGVPTYTVAQPPEAMHVLARRARDIGSAITLAPPLHKYSASAGTKRIMLKIRGSVYRLNASLAIRLANEFIHQKPLAHNNGEVYMNGWHAPLTNGHSHSPIDHDVMDENEDELDREIVEEPRIAPLFSLTPLYLDALENTTLEGRSQILLHDDITFYLDGAHTSRSIKFSLKWFQKMVFDRKADSRFVLVFNCTGDRDPKMLLKPLLNFPFCTVIFCPNIVNTFEETPETKSVAVTQVEQHSQCESNKEAWLSLKRARPFCHHQYLAFNGHTNGNDRGSASTSCDSEDCESAVPEKPEFREGDASVLVSDSVSSALKHLAGMREETEIHVYVTGSLHLVANFLKATREQP